MELIVLSPEHTVDCEQELAAAMLEMGAALFHVRKPAASAASLEKYLSSFPSSVRDRVVLHAPLHVAKALGVARVHLPYDQERPGADMIGFISVSRSLHSLEECTLTAGEYRYVFISPVFSSISKAGYGPGRFRFDDLCHIVQSSSARFAALGGITEITIERLYGRGFFAAASLGAVWGSKEPLSACERLLARCREAVAA